MDGKESLVTGLALAEIKKTNWDGTIPSPKTGTKMDSGKPRTELLDAEFLIDISKVLTVGAKKYSDHNWRGGINFSRVIGAILRHIFAILRGEDIDPEFGLPHTAHLGCEVMFLHWMMLHRKDLDDRYKVPKDATK